MPLLFKLLSGASMLELVTNKEKYFAKNEKQFLEYLHKKNGTKMSKENLAFSFFDLDGLAYYKFPKELSLPMSRLGKLQEYITWLSAGVTGEELDKMIENADKALMEGIKTGKNAAKIGWLLSELKDRKQMIVHEELFYNIIAVQLIRSDESPTEFNNEIQMQKVESFRRLNTENDTFFLNISEYLKALNWSNITRAELLSILNDSTIKVEATKKMMGNLFDQLSQNATTT